MIVYKYYFSGSSTLELDLPVGSQVIYFHEDAGESLCIWVLIHDFGPQEKRIFRFFGTGFKILPNHKYIASCLSSLYVWHLFEEVRDAEPASETTGTT